MKRWTPAVILLLLATGATALVAREAASARSVAGAQSPQVEQEVAEEEQEKAPEPSPAPEPEVEEEPEAPPALAARGRGMFQLMPDGQPVPSLPLDAPSKIKLGVALFRYSGAQGADSVSRSRKEAFQLAQKMLEEKEDFSAIVEAADPGSSLDIGWIRRGVLERPVEYAVFSLDKGEVVSQPVDTPRGIWIARRVR